MTGFVQTQPIAARTAPLAARYNLFRVLFGDVLSTVSTLAILFAVIALAPKLVSWGMLNGIWTGEGAQCTGVGACWAFLRAKYPFILFGIYPPGQYWRPIALIVIFVGLTLYSLPPKNWKTSTLWAWVIGTVIALALMAGGVFGLEAVPTDSWGGLPVTLILTVLSLGLGFPLAIALALGRQSDLKAVKYICVAVIEGIRGLPLLSLLFIVSILLPLMLPDGLKIDKLLRALVAMTVFSAAYLAEVLRGGLQGLHNGQGEAADALSLSWWSKTRLIILPQAISKVIPPLTNTVVVMVKNTSLVLIVGLYDLLSAGRAALADPAWPAPFAETYGFIALIYFIICFSITRYTHWIERQNLFGVNR
ncbi:amino acid ABC transporter permease [Asticcacaulis machinosus]|uniref:Amino acid ABC transporter permease n=1 Tax=Asticcacaulis machinosus TaxID=2984211 RepID=A0ABT5HMT4_9CAUL|nr:amino acid ABC transporter permease [Asticcacaulis machinosus]MDC7677456.1 amino acid ABC transporter permease [Asticcacaulis machinosus]